MATDNWEEKLTDLRVEVAQLREWKAGAEKNLARVEATLKDAAAVTLGLEALVSAGREKSAETAAKLAGVIDTLKDVTAQSAALQEMQQKQQWKLLVMLVTSLVSMMGAALAYVTNNGFHPPAP